MAEEETVQPGWRLPRSLMERIDRVYHTRMAAGPLALTKSEFVADLISGAVTRAEAAQARPEEQRGTH